MTYHAVLLSPLFLQGNSPHYPCFQPKLQTSTAGEAAARCLHCAEPGLRSPAKVCDVHPGQGKTLLRQLRGSRVIIHSCCNASMGARLWAGAEQSRNSTGLYRQALHTFCRVSCFPSQQSLHWTSVFPPSPRELLALVTSNRGLKPPAVLVRASAVALLCHGSTGAIQVCHCFKPKQAEKQVDF